MEIRSAVVLRVAKDVVVKKKAYNAKSPEQYSLEVTRLLLKKGCVFLGFVGVWKGVQTKVAFSCWRGHVETKTIDGIISGKGCWACAKIDIPNRRKLPMSVIMRRINEEITKRDNLCEFVRFDGGYIKNTRKNLVMMCLVHDVEYVTSFADFLGGKGGMCCKRDALRNQKKFNNEELFSILNSIAFSRGNCDVVGVDGEYRNNVTKNIIIKCHNHGEFKTSLHDFQARNTCPLCTKNKKRTESLALMEINEELKNRKGISFSRFEGGFRGVMTRNLVVSCELHGEWTTSMSDFLKGRGCAVCAGNRKTQDVAIQEVVEVVDLRGDCSFVEFEGGYKGCDVKNLIIRCSEHGDYKTTHTLFVRHKQGCLSCAKYGYQTDKPGYIYVQKISGVVDAGKIGIANRCPKQRMTDQKRQSKLEHELIFSHRFEDGHAAKKIEKLIKDTIKDVRGVVPRELMKDGHTETFPVDLLPILLRQVKSLCRHYS
ncbi:GIY-YIG nuclease family protein [Salmonella enterica]|nr:GIY-YIG nuclease family protein [Salmonella enterica]